MLSEGGGSRCDGCFSGQKRFVLFGIEPSEPGTARGYIRKGRELADAPGAHELEAFVENPVLRVAESYLKSRDYL
jgi:mannose-1-phosphate guanylyltransferase